MQHLEVRLMCRIIVYLKTGLNSASFSFTEMGHKQCIKELIGDENNGLYNIRQGVDAHSPLDFALRGLKLLEYLFLLRLTCRSNLNQVNL